MFRTFIFVCALAVAALAAPALPAAAQERAKLDELIASHAAANRVPEALVHRVVLRESRYNPRAIGRGGVLGLMQIKLATARGVGYTGDADGLLDANTNLTYGVRYLAGAFRAADGNHDRAVAFYASGYYAHAKRKKLIPGAPLDLASAASRPVTLTNSKAAAD
jgi:soluble lytic murein transglycosylase-like protein